MANIVQEIQKITYQKEMNYFVLARLVHSVDKVNMNELAA